MSCLNGFPDGPARHLYRESFIHVVVNSYFSEQSRVRVKDAERGEIIFSTDAIRFIGVNCRRLISVLYK